jgi:quercetin dioxygenase-like cupin family protein
MTLFDTIAIKGTTEFGGLVRPVIAKTADVEMSCGTFELKPGESLNDFESHNSDEIFYIASGTLTVLSKTCDPILAREGQIVRIPKGEIHLSKNDGDKSVIVFWCNRD